jgi:hypothetical protein
MNNLARLRFYFGDINSNFSNAASYKPKFIEALQESSRFEFVNHNGRIVDEMLEPSKLNSKDDLLNAAGVAGAVDYADDGVIPDVIRDPSLKNIKVYKYPYMDTIINIKDLSMQNIKNGPPVDHMTTKIVIKDPIMVPIVSKDLPPTIRTRDQVIIDQFIKDLSNAINRGNHEKILKKEFFDNKLGPLERSWHNEELEDILKPYKFTLPRGKFGQPKPIVPPGRIVILPIIDTLIANYANRTDLKAKEKYIAMLNIIKIYVK